MSLFTAIDRRHLTKKVTVLKHPAQMRMMEAMVVETNNWGPFKIYNDNWIIANNVFSAILPTSNLSDQCCEQVKKAAPEQHGGYQRYHQHHYIYSYIPQQTKTSVISAVKKFQKLLQSNMEATK